MHSSAFQLTKEKLDPEDYLKEDDLDFEDGMPISIADYIQDSNREEDITWFLQDLQHGTAEGWVYHEEAQSITFTKEFITSYFQRNYKRFKELASQITLEEFAYDDYSETIGGFPATEMKQLIDDRYEFYVYNGYFKTFDSFVRSLNAEFKEKESVTYYFGGTLDYHF